MSSAGLSSIRQIGLTVRDAARAAEFYRGTLGLPMLFQASKMAFFDCGGVTLVLAPPAGEAKSSSGSIVYFKVDDIDAATEALRSRGVTFEREPHLVAKMPDHELWMAFFRDPDGNSLALMCERPFV